MPRKTLDHSHRDKFSSYMQAVADALGPTDGQRRLLDIPAGSGHFGDTMQQLGYDVVNADINEDRGDFVMADMNGRLPFEDGQFDVVTCFEGIEHVLSPFHLVGELARVTRAGGTVVISTPNVLTLYSRLQFLFTGMFFQFNPTTVVDAPPDAPIDRGHISPITFQRLRYIACYFGLDVADVRTDRYKKKLLLPIHGLVKLTGWPWRRKLLSRRDQGGPEARNAMLARHLTGPALMLGRTMIVFFTKTASR